MLWLGDNPGHNVNEQKQETQLDVFKYIVSRLREIYHGKVYFVSGNHDGFPDGQFDINGGTSQWLLDGYANAAKYWYSDMGIETMRRYGRFSELVPGTQLRIIGLNNFVMDFTNTFLLPNSTDPLGQLKWLEEELQRAENNSEHVIIIGHISPSSKSGERTWGLRYTILMERYAEIVKGQFFGHMHEDYFYTIKSYKDPSKIINIAQVHPPLTTYSGYNPSFRVYKMDREKYELINYDQYRLLIDEANLKGRADWRISHNFLDYYQVKSMSPESYHQVQKRLESDSEYLKKIYIMNQGEGSHTSVPSNPIKLKHVMCKYNAANLYEYIDCTNGTFPNRNLYLRYVILGTYIFPNWEWAIDN